MVNKIYQGDDSLKGIKEGVDSIANAVKVTLGPGGNNVAITKPGKLTYYTKDGVTVAKEYPTEFSIEGVGANLIKLVANDTDNASNDGTTTSSVLAQAFISKAYKKVMPTFFQKLFKPKRINRIDLQKGMNDATDMVIHKLNDFSNKDITEDILESVARVSVNGDKEIAKGITDAFIKVGRGQGTITLTSGATTKTTFEFSNGFKIETPYQFQQFINVGSKGTYELKESIVLTINDDIDSAPQLMTLIEKYISEVMGIKDVSTISKLSVIVLARSFHQNAIADIVRVMEKNPTVSIMPIRVHSVGDDRTEIIKDFASIAGSKVINRKDYLNFTVDAFGKSKKAVQDANKTVVEFDEGQFKYVDVKKRMSDMEAILTKEDLDKADRTLISNRLSNMTRGLVTVFVGGTTILDVSEKLDRYRDAYGALTSADEKGIVKGGGVALLEIQDYLVKYKSKLFSGNESYMTGIDIVIESLSAPFEQILTNIGKTKKEIGKIKKEIKDMDYQKVYDAREQQYIPHDNYYIVDPCKVTESAIKMSTSITSMVLSNHATIMNGVTFEDTRGMDSTMF